MIKSFENLQPISFPKLGYIKIPKIHISDEDKKNAGIYSDDPEEFFKSLIKNGLQKKLDNKQIDVSRIEEYKNRIDLELFEVTRLGFIDYFLLIWSILNFCKKNNILNGPARGSCAGSLLFYLIDVTAVDPIKYDLLFERFIAAERAKQKVFDGVTYIESSSLPDVDIDSQYKEPVLHFIESSFPGGTVSISTNSTFTGKALLRDVLKSYKNYKPEKAQEITDILEKKFGVVESIRDALNNNEKFKAWSSQGDNIEIANLAISLENLYRQKGVHASGVLLSEHKIGEDIPIEMSAKGIPVTSFDMESSQLFGIKVDNLGIETLSLIADIFKQTGLSYKDINPEDPEIYKWLNNHEHYYGLFQISEGLGAQTVKKIKPKNLEELSLCLAMGRPGAMKYIDEYVNFRAGKKDIYVHPNIQDILKPTGGAIVYQEQLMKLCRRMADFTPLDANQVRKATGKKSHELMKKYEQQFKQGCIKNGYEEKYIDHIWQSFIDSASYSFNKCLHPDTKISRLRKGIDFLKVSIKNIKVGDNILSFDTKTQKNTIVTVTDKIASTANVYRFYISLPDKKEMNTIICSLKHKVLTRINGVVHMIPILESFTRRGEVLTSFGYGKISGCEFVGHSITYDLTVNSEDHNFYADNVVVSNSHSVAYGMLTAMTIYLKSKYPMEFFVSCLNMAKNMSSADVKPLENISKIKRELNYFGIKLVGPHLVRSDLDFKIEGNEIIYGLKSIKNISEGAFEKLMKFKKNYNEKVDILIAAKESGLGISQLSSLIQSGCLDGYAKTRSSFVLEAQTYNLLTEREKILVKTYYHNNEDNILKTIKWLVENKNEKGVSFIKESRFETIKKKYFKYKEMYLYNSKREELCSFIFEKRLLGFSYSNTLASIMQKHHKNIMTLQEIHQYCMDGSRAFSAVFIKEWSIKKSKAGKIYLKLDVYDETRDETLLCFDEEKVLSFQNTYKNLDLEEEVLVFNGTKKSDCIFINNFIIQDTKIFLKISEIE